MNGDRGSSADGKTADESAAAVLLIAAAVCLAIVLVLQFISPSSSVLILKVFLLLAGAFMFIIALRRAEMRRRELVSVVRAMQESARKREAEVVAMRGANERVASVSAAKSELFAGIAHELRMPLQGIVGVLRVAADSEASEERTHLLDAARRTAQALLGTIGDILDFTRLEAGRLDLEPVYFSIRLLLADTLEPLGIAAAEKSLTLAYAVAPEVPDRLWGDPGRVRQILVNLSGNAIKFTASGEIVVRVGCGAIAADGVTVVFEIADTGAGIDPSLRALLVNPFSSTQHRQHGLGLPIVSRLLVAMGGAMSIESEVGKGSTFRVLVPFSCEPIGTEPAPEWEKRLAGIRVLLIEPNATTRTILSEIVRAHGMVPEAYESIERALQPSIRAAYGCLIADANLLATTPWIPPVPVVRIASPLTPPVCDGVFVTRPNGERALIQAIGAALGIAEPAIAYTLERRREILRPLRVLVVDDDVNQELIADAARRLGHIVTKTTAAEAPGLLAGREIDVVVVDVQSPQYDGLEFVRRLRALERDGRTAAIAVTTNAMGERDRCTAAGFDAVLQTPATQSAIGAILRDVTSPLTPSHAAPESAGSIFDAVGGNANLLMRVRDAFATQIPRLLAAMRDAIEARDRDALIQAARTLRASISNFDVPEPLAATLQIERAAAADDFARAAALLPAIETAIRELQEKIDAAVG
jgi:two-component system sensor histidine kinase/response regulator